MNTLTQSSHRDEGPQLSKGTERRIEMFGLGPHDHEALRAAHEIINGNVEGLIEAFYGFVRGFPELERFILAPQVAQRLEASFRQYLLTLGQDFDAPQYADGRIRIGSVHEKVGLPIRGYLGAYAHLQEIITRLIFQHCAVDAEWVKLVCAINKVIMLDASLAVDAYHRAALDRIEQLMHQVEEEKEEIRHLAQTDHLTGLLNRRYFYDCLEAEIQRCQRYGNALCVLALDLDNFKMVNDTYGHHVGDIVLKTFSGLLKQYTRKTDLCGRLGGEEFGVILVESDIETTQLMAERLRLAILNEEILTSRARLTVSVSIGIAQWGPHVADASDLLKRADAGLYAAKAAGKNCICVACEDLVSPVARAR